MTQPHPYQPQGQQPQEPYGYQQAPDYPPAAPVQYESYPPAVAVPQPYDPAYQPYDPAHQSPLLMSADCSDGRIVSPREMHIERLAAPS